ncbi:competence protein ComK [Bacillus sp. FJAT-22090]|uniref:competence protein ComK n=1 Tax=Bacillus sp. FJAT-22090 TaxID=1581038 RepID=UPI0006AE03F4|nr:competence protein ComK [Bacillus sp. FJAT-22090]
MKKCFLIDKNTLMLKSVFTGVYKSKIIKTYGVYYSPLSVQQLLANACIPYASTLEGRIQAIKKMMNYFVKTPLLIDPNGIAAFPTISYKNLECVWIFNHHFEVESLGKGKSKVTFSNGEAYIVHVSKNVLLKQKQRLHATIDTYRTIHRD